MIDKKTILIAEDSPLNRMMLLGILEEHYNVIEAQDGLQALEMIRQNAGLICVAILDVYMPNMDGLDVLRAVKADNFLREIPIIICTGEGQEEMEVQAIELGASDFAVKPYRGSVLLSRIKNIIREHELEEHYAPHYDKLTGIYSAATFFEATRQLLRAQQEVQYVLVRWNIERFKLVNDIFGKDKGNEILVGIATALRTHLPFAKCTFARMESDHFVICMPYEMLNIDSMLSDVEKLMATFIPDYKVACNFGIYVIDDLDLSIEVMCDRAKIALVSCRGNYAYPCAVYDEQMRSKMVAQQEMILDMARAIDNEEFEVYYQPMVDVAMGKIVGAEALVRWNHPKRGLISPGEFIPIFEENGFILKLDEYVGRTVCRQLAAWVKQGKHTVPISINLSRITLYNPKLADFIIALVTQYGLSPSMLELEITESAYTEDAKSLLLAMARLQALGFKFLMDDFGSGYSSFNMLKDVPFDILKIDLKFLEGLENHGRSGTILSSILKMAKWLKMPVIAEGVETKFQMEFLRSIGCDKMQGYFFSKPIPSAQFSKLIGGGFTIPEERVELEETIADFESIFSTNETVTKILNSLGGGIGIYELKDDDMDILKVNDGYYNLLGYNPSSLFSDPVPIFDRPATEIDRKLLKNACIYVSKSKKTQHISIRRQNLSGDMLWLKLTIQYLGHSAKKPVLCIAFNDITDVMERQQEQLKITRELQHQHERYQIIARQSGTIIFEWDFSSNGWYGDEGFGEFVLSQVSPHDIFSANITPQVANAQDIPALVGLFSRCEIRDQRLETNARMIKTDGQAVWCRLTLTCVEDKSSDTVRAICTINNVDEKIKKQQQIRYQEEFYRLINRSNNDIIFDYDVEKDIFMYTVRMPDGNFSDYKITDYLSYIPKSAILEDEFKGQYKDALLLGAQGLMVPSFECRANFKGAGFTWHRVEFAGVSDDVGKIYRVVGTFNDIQNEKDIMEKLSREQGYLSALVAESLFAFEYDFETAQANLVHKTKLYEEEFLPYKSYVSANSQFGTIHPDDVAAVQRLLGSDALRTAFKGGEHLVRTRYRIKDRSGRWVWVECSTYILQKNDSDNLQSLVYFKVVDSEKRAHDELVKKAQYDEVSGLYNRATTQSMAQDFLSTATAQSAFLMLDVDNFKSVNDTRGHLVGDQLIHEIGHCLSCTFRVDDIVGRLGGDEFCVLIKNVSDLETVVDKAQQVSYAIKNICLGLGVQFNISASIGLCVVEPRCSFSNMCERADRAMYQAKAEGKDKIVVYKEQNVR
ncbi:MAG: EAL domain-containing protein [Oscillospiraceae bacterium]